MRCPDDPEFTKLVSRIGNGDIGRPIPSQPHTKEITRADLNGINFKYIQQVDEADNPILHAANAEAFVDQVFPNEMLENIDSTYEEVANRAILATTNKECKEWNEVALRRIPGVEHVFYSTNTINKDYVRDTADRAHGQIFRETITDEYINNSLISGIPPHALSLKVGAVAILMRNLDPENGLMNGVKVRIVNVDKNSIECERLDWDGNANRETILIPRITMSWKIGSHPCEIEVTRKQFPLQLSFALTLNRCQGQTLNHIGIDLRTP